MNGRFEVGQAGWAERGIAAGLLALAALPALLLVQAVRSGGAGVSDPQVVCYVVPR